MNSDTRIGVSFKDRNHAIDALCRKVFGAEPSYGEDIPIPTTGEPCDAIKKLERDLALCQAGNRVYAEHNSKLTDERDRLTLQLAELARWKEEQMQVESEWDPQIIGELLGLRIGDSIRKDIEPKIRELKRELAQATEALETERMRLAAVAVVATADTRQTRDRARNMLPEYRSGSLSDVERRVDECIDLREKCDALVSACQWAQVELGKHTRPSPIDTALAMVERRGR